ncbi:MAG: tetratricopeptide repeat protein [Candidatus Omnitrophota bacterium]
MNGLRTGQIIGYCCFLMFCVFVRPGRALPEQDKRVKSLTSYAIGIMHDLHGDTRSAIREFQKSSQYFDNYAVRLRLGADYARLGLLQEAVEDLKRALSFDPANVQARYLLALIYSTRQDYDLAAEQYESILNAFSEADPQNVEIYGYLAQLYYSQKKYHKAIQQFEAVLEIEPDNADVAFLLGALYLEVGQEEDAMEMFRRTLVLDPQNDSCLNSLGYLYAEKGIKLDKAQSLIEQALLLDPDNGAYLDSLGWVMFKKGEYQLALDYLQEALIHLKDPVIYEHLGDVYAAMGDSLKAQKYWRLSLDLLPAQPAVLQKIKTLEQPALD